MHTVHTRAHNAHMRKGVWRTSSFHVSEVSSRGEPMQKIVDPEPDIITAGKPSWARSLRSCHGEEVARVWARAQMWHRCDHELPTVF